MIDLTHPRAYTSHYVAIACEGTALVGLVQNVEDMGDKVYFTLTTQCLSGTNNQLYLIVTKADGSAKFSGLLTADGQDNAPVLHYRLGIKEPVNDWLEFAERIPRNLRGAFDQVNDGHPFVTLKSRLKACFTYEGRRFMMGTIEGIVVHEDGGIVLNVGAAEIEWEEKKIFTRSVSRFERRVSDPPEEWLAVVMDHSVRPAERCKPFLRGTIDFR